MAKGGTVLSLVLIAFGFAVQIIVPLHVIDLRTLRPILSMPPEIFAVFFGIILMVIGIYGLYLFHYKAVAERLDARFAAGDKTKDAAP